MSMFMFRAPAIPVPTQFTIEPSNAFTVQGVGTYQTLQLALNNVADGGTIIVKSKSLFNKQTGFCDRNNVTVRTDTAGLISIFRNAASGDSASQSTSKGIVVLGHYVIGSGSPGTYIGGNGWTFQDIGFENAGWDNNHDYNSGSVSGIKLLGGSINLTRCRFIGCTHGIQQPHATRTDTSAAGIINIEQCLFDGCGTYGYDSNGNIGLQHAIYVGDGAGSQLNVTNSTIQYTWVGHLIKTRTEHTTINNCTFIKSSNTYGYLTTFGIFTGGPTGGGAVMGASRAIDCAQAGVVSVTNCSFYEDNTSQPNEMIGLGGDFQSPPVAPYTVNSFTGSGNKVYSTKTPVPIFVNYINQSYITANGGQPYNQATGGVAVPAGCDKWPGTSGWVNEPVLTTAPAPRFPAPQNPIQVSNWSQVTDTNKWYEFLNTNMNQLQAQIQAHDPAFDSTFGGHSARQGFDGQLSYSGASFDYGLGEMYFCAAGGDGIYTNGWYKLNCSISGSPSWSIMKYPSQLRGSDWTAANNLYLATGRFPGGWGTNSPFITTKGYYPPPPPQTVDGVHDYSTWTPDVWSWPIIAGTPSGAATNNDPSTMQPCAAQYYGGQVVVPGIGSAGQAGIVDIGVTGSVLYDVHAATPTWRYISLEPFGPYGGTSYNNHRVGRKADCYTYWDSVNAKIFYLGDIYASFFNCFAYDPFADDGNLYPATPDGHGHFPDSTNQSQTFPASYLLWNRSVGSQCYDQRKFWFAQRAYGWMWYMDFSAANSGNNYAPAVTPFYAADFNLTFNQSSIGILDRIQCACDVPVSSLYPNGAIIAVCTSGRTVAMDRTTGVITEVVAASGNTIRDDIWDGYMQNGEWGRVRYYPAQKAVVIVSTAARNVKVLKVG